MPVSVDFVKTLDQELIGMNVVINFDRSHNMTKAKNNNFLLQIS